MAEIFSYKNLKQAVFPIERQFHVLKHFSEIDHEFRKYLIKNSEYLDDDIDNRLNEKGSRFFKSFTSDPLHLLNLVIDRFKSDGIMFEWMGDRCEVTLIFSKEYFPEGIGEDCVIHIDKLPEEMKHQLEGMEYEMLQKVQITGKPRKTWKINMIIKKIENRAVIVTIFPGIYAPLLPNHEEQTDEEYRKSMEFWSQHVLIS